MWDILKLESPQYEKSHLPLSAFLFHPCGETSYKSTYNKTFANFIKRPQAISLGLHKQSPHPWTEILVGCGGSLCSYSDTLLGCRILAKVLL
jgi:hypothetical protein